MAERTKRRQFSAAMLCGMLGCICFGSGDWLMSESMILWFLCLLIAANGLHRRDP